MSRNFELLSKALRDDLLQAEPEPEPKPLEIATLDSPREAPIEVVPEMLPQGPEDVELTNLVQRVFLRPGVEAPRMVGFAAAESGAGCSWVCARISRILAAHVAGTVCVVDANLRNPGLRLQFGIDNRTGVNDALSQTEPLGNYARPIFGKKLWIIDSGYASAGLETVTTSERMRSQIAGLRNHFDYVLLDLPPLDKYADGIVLGATCDGMVLVLRANASRRDTVVRAVNALKSANVHVIGVTLNQHILAVPNAIYRRL